MIFNFMIGKEKVDSQSIDNYPNKEMVKIITFDAKYKWLSFDRETWNSYQLQSRYRANTWRYYPIKISTHWVRFTEKDEYYNGLVIVSKREYRYSNPHLLRSRAPIVNEGMDKMARSFLSDFNMFLDGDCYWLSFIRNETAQIVRFIHARDKNTFIRNAKNKLNFFDADFDDELENCIEWNCECGQIELVSPFQNEGVSFIKHAEL